MSARVPVEPGGVIMVLDSIFPPRGGGGAEFQVKTLVSYFARCGVPMRVVVPMVRYGPLVSQDVVDGIPVYRIPYPNIRLVGGLVMLMRLALFLIRERNTFVALHAHIAHNMASMTSIVGRLLGKPVIVKLTGLQELEHGILAPQAGLMQRLVRRGIRQARWVQATSTRIRNALIQKGFDAERVLAIPNAVDVTRFRPQPEFRDTVRAKFNTPLDALVVVYSGRMEVEKGVKDLVEAWARGVQRTALARLWLVGSGRQVDSVAADIRRLGIEHQVSVLGPRDHVEQILCAADVCVLPSYNEGLSNTLLEAMACGLPVLGTRVSGTEDFVVTGSTGLLVEPRDVDGLARALAELIGTSREKLAQQGRNACERIHASAAIEHVAELLAERYGVKLRLGARSTAEIPASGGAR